MTRLAAFVFSELVEESATLSSLGEARSERARRAYFDVVRRSVAAAGGRELANTGDGVLAVFESATDALQFATSVLRGCDRERRRSGEELDVRVGVDIGETASLDDGSGTRGVAAVARAQQLARAADSGRVLASGVVAALATAEAACFCPAGLLQLPGTAEPVSVVEVEWARPVVPQAPLPPELEVGGTRTPFVGRAAELERLRAAWRRVLGGERQLAFVVGEPGIGKTRLVAELARELHEQSRGVLWGRSLEETLTPYQPFVQALQHHVRSTPPADLREQVGEGAYVVARLLPELQARLALAAVAVEEPESERYRLFEAVSRLLAAASAERPILLVLDDLQWADQGTLLLLKHLARDPSPAPLFLLGTYRGSEVARDHPLALIQADVERDRIVERVDLAGLAEDEVATLVGALIGWVPSAEVARNLRGETAGNPFFLEEVVRHLAQLGLSGDPERFATVRATVRELGVPARVRELVGRRVQRLSQSARAALSTAAVIGSEFDGDVLASVLSLESEREVVGALDEAVEAQLLVESTERVGRYRFWHALIHQALYEEQTLNRRATRHGQVASALERLRPDAPELHAEIAHHYARAGGRHAAEVVRHGCCAGEHALGLFAYEDAVRELSQALAVLDSVDAGGARERAELLVLLGTAQTRAGDSAAARAAFLEAAELAGRSGTWQVLARAALGYGGGTHFGGIWEAFLTVDTQLVQLLEQALEACPAGESRERVRLLGRLAQALYWSPERERALRLSDEALASARRLGDPVALAAALDSRSVALWTPDGLDERRLLAEEMLVLGRELGDREIQLQALCWLITCALERGSITALDEWISEHDRIATELRQPYHLWFAEVMRAMRAHLEGRLDEAMAHSERAHDYGRLAHGNAQAVHTVQTLFLSLDQGHAERVLGALDRSDLGWPPAFVRVARALAFAGLDRREEALEEIEFVAGQGLGSFPRDALWTMTLVVLGRTVAHFDDPTYADELYGLLLPYDDRVATTGGPALCLGPVSRILGMLARAAGRPEVALEHFADALERSRALGSPPLVARTHLEAAKAHLLRGGAGDTEEAERLLAEAAPLAATLGMAKLRHDIETLQSAVGGVRA